jgi:SulP family sulfate permease
VAREKRGKAILYRYIPIAEWLPAYQKKWLTRDLVASLSVWAISIPTALAFASIAGLPVEYGLYAGVLSGAGYAAFGSSRQLVVGPSSTPAIITAATIAPLAAGKSQEAYVGLAVTLALMTGVICLLAGLAKLGFLANFLAKPVLEGFVVALSITIVVGQLDKLMGISAEGSGTVTKFANLLGKLGDWSWATVALSAACLLILFLLARYTPRLPAALIVLVLAIIASSLFALSDHGIQVVGEIPKGLPRFTFTGEGIRDIFALLPGALAIFVVGFAESISMAKSYASKRNEKIDANQELIGIGAANLGSGLFQGFAVDGSLSKTAASDLAGGKTPVVLLGCSALTLLTVLFLTPLFKSLPQATLGAIVIFSVWKLIDFREFKRFYEAKKTDLALALAAFFGVLLIDVLEGILIGVILSLLAVISRISWPNTAVLGRDASGTRYGSLAENPDYRAVPDILIYRFDAPLIFSNAEGFADEVRRLADESDPPVKAVIINCEMIHDMDTTATDELIGLHSDLTHAGIEFYMARVRAEVRDFMARDGIVERIGEERYFHKVGDAVDAFIKLNRPEG